MDFDPRQDEITPCQARISIQWHQALLETLKEATASGHSACEHGEQRVGQMSWVEGHSPCLPNPAAFLKVFELGVAVTGLEMGLAQVETAGNQQTAQVGVEMMVV